MRHTITSSCRPAAVSLMCDLRTEEGQKNQHLIINIFLLLTSIALDSSCQTNSIKSDEVRESIENFLTSKNRAVSKHISKPLDYK